MEGGEGVAAAWRRGHALPGRSNAGALGLPYGFRDLHIQSGFWKNGGQRGAGVRGRALGMLEEGHPSVPVVPHALPVGWQTWPTVAAGVLNLGDAPPLCQGLSIRIVMPHLIF